MPSTNRSIDRHGSGQPAVKQAVAKLRRDCLSLQPGEQLGQEEELLALYGCSRPTLRQAAALVGQEQLVMVRRGPGGGYFAHRPDSSGVAHMAAIYLQVQNVQVSEIIITTSTLRGELAPAAARNIDAAGRAELAQFLADDRAVEDGDYDFALFLRAERQQNDLVGRLSRNRALHLYMQISLDLVALMSHDQDHMFGHRVRYLEWRHQRNRMLDAILEGDPDIARLQAQRCADKVLPWLQIDAAKASKRRPVEGTAAE